MSYKVKRWGEWWVMNLEGIWKEAFLAQLGFSLEEMSKSTNYVEMVDYLVNISVRHIWNTILEGYHISIYKLVTGINIDRNKFETCPVLWFVLNTRRTEHRILKRLVLLSLQLSYVVLYPCGCSSLFPFYNRWPAEIARTPKTKPWWQKFVTNQN